MIRRPDGSLFVSIVVHIVLGAALAYVLAIPYPIGQLFHRDRSVAVPVERVSFFTVPDRGVNSSGRSGGDGRPVRRDTPPPQAPVAPSQVPTSLPPAAPPVAPKPESGSGAVVGKGGATEGITPSVHDPSLWVKPGTILGAPKSAAEEAATTLSDRLRASNDSMAQVAANGARLPEWVTTRGGKKYGIDQNKIYIGGIAIPTALLALLPLNQQSNPQQLERNRAISAMTREINFQAQRAMNEDEFRAAVKRIRERKEKEHQEQEKAKAIPAPQIP